MIRAISVTPPVELMRCRLAGTNSSQVTLASDMVFSDGASVELPTMSGSVAGGLTASITVAV